MIGRGTIGPGATCVAVLLAALVAAFGSPGESRAQSVGKVPEKVLGAQGSLLVGVVGPQTGEEAAYGRSVVAGALAAARRLNAQGGIGGRTFEVLHFDDRSNTELTTGIVRELIRRNAVAILAAPTGASTFAPIHLINESRTPFFAVGTRRHLRASGPYVFRSAVPDELATEDLVRYAVAERGYVNYALVTIANSDYSLDLGSLFRRALLRHGGQIRVQADGYDTLTGGQNLGAVVSAIRRAAGAVQAVIFTGSAAEGVLFAREMHQAGLKLPILGSEDLFAEEYLKAGEAVAGTLVYATFAADGASSKTREFVREFGSATPDRFAALAYDTTLLLAEAIRKSGSVEGSRIREALIGRGEFEGATGKTSFARDNAPVKHPLIYELTRGAGGQGSFVLKADMSRRPAAAPGRKSGAK